jgi:large subunit ribosomal protein L4
METKILNIEGTEIGKSNLPDSVFNQKPQKHFLHEVIVAYLTNKRQGSACTKVRSEVSGGGRKPWKQKGTGRARHGSIRSPLWKGGGVVFGPRPRNYEQVLSKKKKRLALVQSLSAQFAENKVIVVDKFELEEAKTKKLNTILQALKSGKKPMLVTCKKDEKILLAGKNITGFKSMVVKDLNAYDVLNSTKVIITASALKKLSDDAGADK